jgi:hypothetical protein
VADLIVHIGLSKCASTTLQNQVFKGERGYLGTHQECSITQNYARQFKAFSPVGPRQWSNFRQVKRWVKSVRENHDDSIKRYLLSDEMLTNRNKLVQRPVIPFLKKFSDTVWTDGQIKVILVLRIYAERIASGYAQVAASNPRASQADFERHIKHLLQNGPTHDYSKWVAELYDAFGQDKVCILLMEEIGQVQFWQHLKDFCQLELFQPASMQNSRKNSKRKNKNSWTISPYDPAVKAKTIALNLFGFGWPHYIAPKQRQHLLEMSREKLTAFYASKYADVNRERETEIHLTENLRHAIREHYRISTAQLSDLLGKDMAALGY